MLLFLGAVTPAPLGAGVAHAETLDRYGKRKVDVLNRAVPADPLAALASPLPCPDNAPPVAPVLAKQETETMADAPAQVGLIMGSQSDWTTLRHAADTLDSLGIAFETRIVSAHRTPKRMVAYGESARERGLKVIIAGAGSAAHLPGMIAALTPLPVFGVPIESQALKGLDSLLSIVQMPGGVPVGTLAIGKAGAINAALMAGSVLALSDPKIATALDKWRAAQTGAVAEAPRDEA